MLIASSVKAEVKQDSVEAEKGRESPNTTLETLPELGEVAQTARSPLAVSFAQSRVTEVQLNPTAEGLELVLTTTGEQPPESFETRFGDTLVIDLINTQLQLPERDRVFQENPAAVIASIEVVQQYANTVRVRIVGTDEIPTAEVTSIGQGLALNVTTDMTTAETPSPPEEEPTTPTEEPETAPPMAEGEEPIELIVTATRTEEREEDIPGSVTVIDCEQIEEQSNLTTNLQDILGQTVPGLEPPTFSTDFTPGLRGRAPQVLINGVPISSNQDAGFSLGC